jgi:FkbM family methyltransferase
MGTRANTVKYLLLRYVARRRYLTARARRYGLRFRFTTADAVGRAIYKRGDYEPALTDFLTAHLTLRPGDVAVDVGANLGWYSVVLDRVAPPGVTIVAFEPDPVNYRLLCENLRLNGAAKVVPVNAALADAVGRARLYLYPDKNRGRHSFLPRAGAETVDVATTTLDAFWASRRLAPRKLRFLKVDVEGYEYSVLRGAAAHLRECRLVVTELAPATPDAPAAAAGAVVSLMEGLGFRPHLVTGDAVHAASSAALRAVNRTVEVAWLGGAGAGDA